MPTLGIMNLTGDYKLNNLIGVKFSRILYKQRLLISQIDYSIVGLYKLHVRTREL